MSLSPEPTEQLKDTPLRFLESEQFQEMLDTYEKLKPLEKDHPRKFKNQMNIYDFGDIYPIMDSYLQTHDLSTPKELAEAVTSGAPETVTFAATLLGIFDKTIAARVQEYDVLGNSPATYFICGVWANMKRGREFHPSSNGITVTYSEPDAYGNQNIRYRNKDYEMTIIFEAVAEYTKNLSWTAHRLLNYSLMRGNADNWRNNTATFSIEEYMDWAGLRSRDAAYRQIKKDMQSITGMKITAESFKKYFESFYITHLATEASIKKYTGEVRISFAENVRHFLTQYYQLIPDWMGHLSENAYRMAFYLFYRARKAPVDEDGIFRVKIQDIIHYIGLPTKEDVKNRNYDEAIIRPFNKAVEEIEDISGGSIQMDFDYDDINTFLGGKMNVSTDATMQNYIQQIEKNKTVKQLEAKKKQSKKPPQSSQ